MWGMVLHCWKYEIWKFYLDWFLRSNIFKYCNIYIFEYFIRLSSYLAMLYVRKLILKIFWQRFWQTSKCRGCNLPSPGLQFFILKIINNNFHHIHIIFVFKKWFFKIISNSYHHIPAISLHRESHLSLAKIKNDLSLLYKIFLIKYYWLHESKLEMSNYKGFYSNKWYKTDFEIFNDKYLNLNEK